MSWTYNRETKSFISDECNCKVPYHFNDNYNGKPFENRPDAYHINILYRGELKESNSYTLRKKSDGSSELLGWAVSLLTLFTEDETIRKHEHIAEYAYILHLYLLNDCGVGQLIVEHDCSFLEGVMLWCKKVYGSETWHQNLLFCVMDKEYAGDTLNFSYYLPYFANLDLHIRSSSMYHKEGALELPDTFGSNIIIQAISPALINGTGQLVNPYLENYHQRVLDESSELMRFFLLYQVLEVMMDRVLLDILHHIINSIEQENGGMRDFDKQLSETNEKDRIAKVFEYAGIDYNTKSNLPFHKLFEDCNQLLLRKKHKTHTSLAYSIYNVRNLMVHRLRTLNQATDDIKPINDALYLTINAILINYKNTHPKDKNVTALSVQPKQKAH